MFLTDPQIPVGDRVPFATPDKDTVVGALCKNRDFFYGIAEAVVPAKGGAKWVILGCKPRKGIISTAKRDRILNIADYIGEKTLAARLLSPPAGRYFFTAKQCGKSGRRFLNQLFRRRKR